MARNIKYVSFGNRRDKNLSDVESPREALENLIDGLDGPGTFVNEDLNAIRGLQFEKVGPTTLSRLAGITVKVTNPDDPAGFPVAADPLVTIKDRVENARTVTGDVPSFKGGTGLDARFFESTDIRSGNAASTGADIFIFNNNQIIEKEYWEYGFFQHGTLLDPTFEDEYGGIQWTGYFSPEPYDVTPSFAYYTTGLLIFEYDPFENDQWVKAVNLYAQNRTVTVTASSTGNVLSVQTDNHLRLSIGDKLAANPSITVTGLSQNQVTLSENYSVTNGNVVTFTRELGKDYAYGRVFFNTVEPGKFIKVRISYWFPDNNQRIETKYLQFTYFDGSLPFVYLYSDKPLPPTNNEIRTFLNEALSPFNSNIGVPGAAGNGYRSINIAKTYINEYVPPSTLTQIRSNGPVTLTATSGSSVIVTSSEVGNTNVGNYIVPTGATNLLPKLIQVKGIYTVTNTSLVVDTTLTSNFSQQVNFIDHKGFIDWFYATSTGTTVNITGSTTEKLQTNNIVITSATTNYVRITSINSPTSFSTSSALNLNTSQPIFIYSEKGITDNSKKVFCAGVLGVTLASNAEIGNTLVMTSNVGLTVGQVVQYSGFISETPFTTITSIAGNTVSLSGVNTVYNRILANSTITFAPAGTDINKEICILPLDTSPPFFGTPDGLSTLNRGLKSDATLTQDFIVETSNLNLQTSAGNITTVLATPFPPNYDLKIRINNNQFFVLGKIV